MRLARNIEAPLRRMLGIGDKKQKEARLCDDLCEFLNGHMQRMKSLGINREELAYDELCMLITMWKLRYPRKAMFELTEEPEEVEAPKPKVEAQLEAALAE